MLRPFCGSLCRRQKTTGIKQGNGALKWKCRSADTQESLVDVGRRLCTSWSSAWELLELHHTITVFSRCAHGVYAWVRRRILMCWWCYWPMYIKLEAGGGVHVDYVITRELMALCRNAAAARAQVKHNAVARYGGRRGWKLHRASKTVPDRDVLHERRNVVWRRNGAGYAGKVDFAGGRSAGGWERLDAVAYPRNAAVGLPKALHLWR